MTGPGPQSAATLDLPSINQGLDFPDHRLFFLVVDLWVTRVYRMSPIFGLFVLLSEVWPTTEDFHEVQRTFVHRVSTMANVHVDIEASARVNNTSADVWLFVLVHPYRPTMEAQALECALLFSKILSFRDTNNIDHGLAAQAIDRRTTNVHQFHAFEETVNQVAHFGKDFFIDRIVGHDVPVMQPLVKSFKLHVTSN